MAMRGTAVHGCLAGVVRGVDLAISDDDVRGLVEVGKSMFQAWRAEWPDLEWLAELKIDSGIPDCYGTADVVGISPWLNVAVIADWKTGRGSRDDAGASLQLAAYALGVLRNSPYIERFVLIMAELEQQPTRCEFTRAQLVQVAQEIRRIIAAAESTQRQLTPSAEACQYCRHRVGCPAIEKTVVEGAASLPAVQPEAVRDLAAADAGKLLTRYRPLIDLVESFGKSLEERVKSALSAGEEVPGWKIKTTPGARDWTLPTDELVRALRAQVPDLDMFALATPAEVERRIVERLKRDDVKTPKKAAEKILAGVCKGKPRVSLESA
jgi:hypothetical protein